jgi:hypothetical protein
VRNNVPTTKILSKVSNLLKGVVTRVSGWYDTIHRYTNRMNFAGTLYINKNIVCATDWHLVYPHGCIKKLVYFAIMAVTQTKRNQFSSQIHSKISHTRWSQMYRTDSLDAGT